MSNARLITRPAILTLLLILNSHLLLAQQASTETKNQPKTKHQSTTPQKPTTQEKSKTPAPEKVKLPGVAVELAKRVERDQKARFKLIGLDKQDSSDAQNRTEIFNDLARIDKENTSWLKTEVESHGWLGKTLVGTDGAHSAWLLVQHADKDREFQTHCLKLMSEMPKGEVAPIDFAYLTDRVLVADNKPQRYGTQCVFENGKAVVKDVEDRENLNKRRTQLGMDPIEDYLKLVESMYTKQDKKKN